MDTLGGEPLKMVGLEFLPSSFLQSWACKQFDSVVTGHLITGPKRKGQFIID